MTCRDDSDQRRLRGCSCVTHDYERSATCCTAHLEWSACRHHFCTVTGHFQAALKDSSVWTIVRLTTDLVTCPWSFAYGRINTTINNNNNNKCIKYTQKLTALLFELIWEQRRYETIHGLSQQCTTQQTHLTATPFSTSTLGRNQPNSILMKCQLLLSADLTIQNSEIGCSLNNVNCWYRRSSDQLNCETGSFVSCCQVHNQTSWVFLTVDSATSTCWGAAHNLPV